MRLCWTSLLVGLCLASCLSSGAIPCGDHVCPKNTTCDKPTGLCVPALCGNDQVNGTEECDGAFANEDCTDHGFYFPDGLACSPVCTLDTTGCTGYCGDHTINGPETCDGIPPAGVGCADFGFDVGQLGCSGSCTPAFAACAPIGWSAMPGGATNELHAVAGTLRTVFAVGFGGTILKNVDGVWVPMTSPTQKDLYGVTVIPGMGTDPDTAYAVGAAGTILAFDGMKWSEMPSPVSTDLFAVSAADATTVYAVGAGVTGGTILELTGGSWVSVSPAPTAILRGVLAGTMSATAVGDGGLVVRRAAGGAWSTFSFPFTVATLNAVSSAGGVLYVAGSEKVAPNLGFAAKLEISGWTRIALPKLDDLQMSVSAVTPSDVWFSGATGGIVHWDGTHALRSDTGTSRTVYGVLALGPARAVAVTRGGEVLGYNGTSRSTQPMTNVLNAAARVADGVIAVGFGAALTRFNGTRWTFVAPTDTGIADTANLVTAFSNDSLVLVGAAAFISGESGGIYYSTDQGLTFTEASPAGLSVNGIYGAGGDYYAVADEHIYRSAAGTSWSEVAAPPVTFFAAWGVPDGSVFYAVGQDAMTGAGRIYRGKGTTWTPEPIPPVPNLHGIWGASATDIYAVGSFGTVLHYDGARWRTMYTGTGQNFVTINGSSAQDIFIGGPGIRFHFDGTSWSRMSDPAVRDISAIVSNPSPPGTLLRRNDETSFVGSFFGVETFSRACTLVEDRCEDPWDNDCDGVVNCADDDCDTLSCARGGVCETQVLVECGTTIDASTYTGIARINDLPCLDVSTPGPEASFRFVGEGSRQVTVTIATEDADDLELVVTGTHPRPTRGAGPCDLDVCTPATPTSSGRSVTFLEAPDAVRYFVVDGPIYTARNFTLSVDCQ